MEQEMKDFGSDYYTEECCNPLRRTTPGNRISLFGIKENGIRIDAKWGHKYRLIWWLNDTHTRWIKDNEDWLWQYTPHAVVNITLVRRLLTVRSEWSGQC
jgi:hypothetical protein